MTARRRQVARAAWLVLLLLASMEWVEAATKLSIRIRRSDGGLADSIRVVVVNRDDRRTVDASTSTQGVVQLDLDPGSYFVYVRELRETNLVARIYLFENRDRHLEIQLGPGFDDPGRAPDVERTSTPSEDQVSGRTHPDDRAEDPSLTIIRDYRIRIGQGPAKGTRPLAELINPFPVERSGRYHGSIYEFHRNDNFDARNFFDPVGKPLPEYKRNQFGLNLGATLGENLNLFSTYEGLRIVRGSTLLSHVPTEAMRRGDFSALTVALRDPQTGQPFAGNTIPMARIHPVARRMLALLPAPNRNEVDRNFVNNDPFRLRRDTVTVRVDVPLAEGSKLFARYSLSDGREIVPRALPAFSSTQQTRDQGTALGYTHHFSARLVANARLDFNRNFHFELSRNAGRAGLLESVGIAGLGAADLTEQGYPDFLMTGYANLGDGASPRGSVGNRLTAGNGWAYSRQDHTWRLDAELSIDQVNDHRAGSLRRGRFLFNGFYAGDGFADFLLGLPHAASRGIGSDRVDLRARRWSISGGDQWRIGPRLELSVGVTYALAPRYRSTRDDVSFLFPLLVETPPDAELVLAGSQRARALGFGRAGRGGAVFADRNDWAPRLSLAFSPLGHKGLVLRGSYSILYAPLGAGHFTGFLGRNFPFYYFEDAVSSAEAPELDLSDPFASSTLTELSVRGIEPELKTPYVQRWRFSIHSAIGQNWNLEASYLGSKGSGLARVLYGNVPLPGPGTIQPRRPNPVFGRLSILTGSGSSIEHTLDLAADRRLAEGFSLKSGLTWTRQINDLFRGSPANPRNLRAERAASEWAPAWRFFLNYIYDLPFGRDRNSAADRGWTERLLEGWRLSGITHIQDGTPFTVQLPGDQNNDGLAGERPNRIGPAALDPARRSIDGWFDTADFALPPAYSFGDSGRNILIGPGYRNWDLSIVKRTRFPGGKLLEFRAELFNALNDVNFDDPNPVFGTSLFGKIFGAARSREIELAVKYSF
ncbi:MAG: hypothetical protein ACR2L2_04315 [Acidobacteriota bacterium]